MDAIWKPHVVVAAIVERGGRFLLVEEETEEGLRLNQPAGHLEPGESVLDAVRRETLEETGHTFTPESVVGVYRLYRSDEHTTFIRFAFAGTVGERDTARALDEGIVRADWFSLQEIRSMRERHRSSLVLCCIEDYLAGNRFPLAILHDCLP